MAGALALDGAIGADMAACAGVVGAAGAAVGGVTEGDAAALGVTAGGAEVAFAGPVDAEAPAVAIKPGTSRPLAPAAANIGCSTCASPEHAAPRSTNTPTFQSHLPMAATCSIVGIQVTDFPIPAQQSPMGSDKPSPPAAR